jgi:hypothetical protein
MARRGKLSFVQLPDGEIRFNEQEIKHVLAPATDIAKKVLTHA